MNGSGRNLTRFSAAAMLGLSGYALAAPPVTSRADPIETITVIGAKMERPLADVANSITVIDADRIDRELTTNLKDLVRYEPGVSVSNDASRFGIGAFNIRGIEANRVAMELDGVPVIEGFAIGDFASSGRNLVDPGLLKSVEILRGPASALYGSDAMGGVVAFTTRDPEDFLLGSDRYVGLRSTYAGVDASLNLAGTAAIGHGPFSGLVSYVHRRGNERDNAVTSPNPQSFRNDNLLAKLVYTGAEGHRGELTFDATAIDVDTDVRSLIGGPGRFAATTALLGDDADRRYRLSFEYALQAHRAWADQLIGRAYWQSAAVTQRTTQQLAPSPPRTPYATERWRRFDYDQDAFGGELTIEKSFRIGATPNRLVFGIEAMRARIVERRDGLLTNLLSGTTSNAILGESFPVRDFPISATVEIGVYGQDEIAITDRLKLIPAMRYEHYRLDPESDSVFTADNPTTVVAPVRQSSLSPKIGLLYRLNENHTLYGQYARGFRSPPFDDVNIGFTILLFGYTAIPNPDLKPETSDGFELGWRFHTGASDVSLALFLNRYRNLIESRVNLGVDARSGFVTFQSQNRDRADIRGVEFRSRLALADWVPRMAGLHLNLSAAWQYGQDTARDEPLNSIDPIKGLIGIAYDAPSRRWGAELITTLAAKKGRNRIDRTNVDLFAPPAYQTVDLIGFVTLHERVQINWGIMNLLDEHYWEWADTRGVPAGDPNVPLHARPGRNASISLNLSWR